MREDDSDSDDDEEDYCALLAGENPEHYVDTRYEFESLNGASDIPPEFQLEIQHDMRIVADFVGLLDNNGNGVSYRTDITGANSLAEKPIQEEEDAAAASTTFVFSASSPISKLSTHVSQTGPFTPVGPITYQNSSLGGSPNDRLEESPR